MQKNKEDLLKKIFNVTDMQPIFDRVLEDWSDMQISLKAGNLTVDEKIAVLEAKEKDIVVGKIKIKKLK